MPNQNPAGRKPRRRVVGLNESDRLQCSVRLSFEVKRMVEKMAKQQGVAKGDILETAIREYYRKEESKQRKKLESN